MSTHCLAFASIVLSLVLPSVSAWGDEFPQPYDSQSTVEQPLTSAQDSAAKIALPPGFRAALFAAEPDVQNPIACDWDRSGRLWIAENYTYAEHAVRFDLKLRDRITILDGAASGDHLTSRKVFADDLEMLTSIAIGSGGVWAMCPPRLIFIPNRDGDDLPDGAPETVLDGFEVGKSYHNFANGLKFGPDGWLYGRCGASCPGEIGVPGTPAEQRVPLRGGMWRYHPTRKTVEAINYGTTNPWGHDWDQHGELFFINTVGGHLWHSITGAHFPRSHSIDPNTRAYTMIDQHTDHWHFDTSHGWKNSGLVSARDYGGGHAHIGMMIYQGGSWPASYADRLYTINMHGRCVNQEILERIGSGYIARHGQNLFELDDPWFRGLELTYGPDGQALMLDWSDIGECHESDGVHRSSGRIYKLSYEKSEPAPTVNIAELDESGLVALHKERNEWFVRQARRELIRRQDAGAEMRVAVQQLRHMFDAEEETPLKLRALWTLYALGRTDDEFLRKLLSHSDEHLRVWGVRLLTDEWPLDTVVSGRPPRDEAEIDPALLAQLTEMAATDPSGLVRLTLASTLQRLPVPKRAELAAALVAHAEDAEDHNLPLLIWYGLIPLGESDPAALAQLAGNCQLPQVRNFIARRLAEDIDKRTKPVDQLLQIAVTKPEAFQADIVAGLTDALAGLSKAHRPAAWSEAVAKLSTAESATQRDRVRDLDALFGDEAAADKLRSTALDVAADADARKTALQMLVRINPRDLRSLCEQLLDDSTLSPMAIRGLGRNKDARVAKLLIEHYDGFAPPARAAAVDVLASRAAFARALLQAVAAGQVPRTEITSFHVRQMRGLKDNALDKALTETWGELRDVSADKKQQITSLKQRLTAATLAAGDAGAGRALFSKTCATCHRLYGEGQTIGPDLTGAGRDNLQYLLDNIVDPSAVVTADFRMSVIVTDDGRTLNGVVVASTPQSVTLQTATERVTLSRAEIVEQQVSPLSLMPEGLLGPLNESQIRDLFAYLMTKQQVPLPGDAGG